MIAINANTNNNAEFNLLFQLFDLYLCVFNVGGREGGEYKERMNRVSKENRKGKKANL